MVRSGLTVSYRGWPGSYISSEWFLRACELNFPFLSQGIGRSTALLFAKEGAKVVASECVCQKKIRGVILT